MAGADGVAVEIQGLMCVQSLGGVDVAVGDGMDLEAMEDGGAEERPTPDTDFVGAQDDAEGSDAVVVVPEDTAEVDKKVSRRRSRRRSSRRSESRKSESRNDSVNKTMLRRAEKYLDAGNIKGARKLVDRVIERDPRNRAAKKLASRITAAGI